MSTNADRLYRRMNSRAALETLIGEPEDADFDCKEWSTRQDAMRGSIAKAACGFANATGCVIVVGLKASGSGANMPDVVERLEPVADRKAVASIALDIILKSVEPGIEGLKIKAIPDSAKGTTGFVLLLIPASEGTPRRSKVDWKFYVRIASGTVPMEMFQIEERFGKRPAPRLSLYLEPQQMMERSGFQENPLRHLVFGLKNDGRGLAKFPGLRFKRSPNLRKDDFGIDGNCGFGLPPRPSDPDWISFRGGVDDVIYPGETRLIGKLIQVAVKKGDTGVAPALRAGQVAFGFPFLDRLFVCEALNLEYEISSEGTETQERVLQLTEDSTTVRLPVR
jgi:hypothetical protein